MNERELIDPFIPDSEETTSKFINPNKPKTIKTNNKTDFKDKDIEEKVYIILYKIDDDSISEEYQNIYSICIGRTEAYNDIKNKILSGMNIDIHKSKIITETKQTETRTSTKKYFLIPYNECISIYSFCISVEGYYSYTDFNIEDFNNSAVEEDIEDEDNNFLTADQLKYKEMLDNAMKSNVLLSEIEYENDDNNI